MDPARPPHRVEVSVEVRYAPEHSSPGQHIFVYTITILNAGLGTVQLIDRYWEISEANGRIEEVRGEGVVGEQPVLAPGSSHRYSSFAQIGSPPGAMRGRYGLIDEAGERFEADIPVFGLHTRALN